MEMFYKLFFDEQAKNDDEIRNLANTKLLKNIIKMVKLIIYYCFLSKLKVD